MDALKGFGELGLGSRLKRLSEHMMKDIQYVYTYYNIDFDPYLFPVIKIIDNYKTVTNKQIKESLKLSQPAISQAITKLTKKGMISIDNDAIDGRKKIIALSKKGEAIVDQMRPLWRAMEQTVKQYTLNSSGSLIEHINNLEHQLQQQSLSHAIIDRVKDEMKTAIQIVDFKASYATYFYDLNIEWLRTYFYVEAYDEAVLSAPNKYIIDKGGYIFFALKNDAIVGTVALMPTEEDGIFELTKMAVLPEQRGQKIGQHLLKYCIDFARHQHLKGLLLYSSTKLENAIYLYRKYGFKELELEKDNPYERADIKMLLEI